MNANHRLPDFSPALLEVQDTPPHPWAGAVVATLVLLVCAALAWAILGRLDIIAVSDGRLVPASYVKIVQPAEAGIVQEILVREGERVRAGQVLIRMDRAVSEADRQSVLSDVQARRLALRRIDAQLSGGALARQTDDPPALLAQASAQLAANRQAHEAGLAQERSVRERARHELAAAERIRAKLLETLPHYDEQARAFDKLARDGYAGRLMAADKLRERAEREHDLRAQESAIAAAGATIEQSERRLAQIAADYRRGLETERVETATLLARLEQELAKQTRRAGLQELRAPQDGVVKELATHTAGAVASPGTVLMTLVPENEPLRAEVWVRHEDVGFVRAGQPVRIKIAAFPFQKYGMLDGMVAHVSADASEAGKAESGATGFRALVDLARPVLETEAGLLALSAGMKVAAEINLGERSVLEYVLSPVSRAWQEAGRER